MKYFLSLLSIFLLNPLFAQDKTGDETEQIEISQKDSSMRYLRFIERNQTFINDAQERLNNGFKSPASDSMHILVDQFKEIIDAVIVNTELVPVATHLSAIQNIHLEWMKATKDYFTANSYKLIEYDQNKRSLLNRDAHADTTSIDKLIEAFFEDLENVPNQWKNLFMLERNQLEELPDPPVKIKK